MPDRTRDIELYENEGALLTLGSSQVISFTNFDSSSSATVTFDDSAPNNGAWNSGETATIGDDPATVLGTGLSYAGVKVTILGITLANIQLSTPVQTALLDVNGTQMLHFYNADGSEADPAALLDSLATQLVTALSSGIPPLLQGAVKAILMNPLQFVQNNALLTMTLTAGGSVPFVPCFTAGTMIMTRKGEVAVDRLRVGDEVLTVDKGFRPIRWIGSRTLSARQLQCAPQLRPIRFEIGALGNGLPLRPLEVSPQHRCLIRSEIAQRMVGAREVLAAAKHLLAVEGVSVVETNTPVTYFHILLDSHELLISNGAATESFFIGPVGMSSMSANDRLEIITLFPELSTEEAHLVMPPARKFLVGHIAKSIVARAIKNTSPVVEPRNYTSA
ncbi:MAG: Hint domain-containing protein [Cypionkella sp.]|uniref:Hint domain-containing protein n=1 Tax=Cypionkella sp. TaxID=2811411 RepID=UPI002ABC677A|nr:Hint domain-containing protein [Cypionkella sp.]MDZ4312132.1 Hint domain-containing protein [Cypionkella sp.]